VFDGGGSFAGEIGDQVLVTGRAGEFSGVTQITMFEMGPVSTSSSSCRPRQRCRCRSPGES
jgi:predicted extracellular nuclease